MNHVAAQLAPPRVGRFLLFWLGAVLGLMASQASAAIQLSPSTVSLPAGTYAAVQITGANGNISVTAANTDTATVTLSGVSRTSATLNIFGKAAGSTSVVVRSSNRRSVRLPVTVTQATPPLTLAVAPTSLSLLVGRTGTLSASRATGSISASSSNTRIATVLVSANVVTVRAVALGSAVVSVRDSRTTVNVPSQSPAPPRRPASTRWWPGTTWACTAWTARTTRCSPSCRPSTTCTRSW